MVRYEFHADSSIMEIESNGGKAFIDLSTLEMFKEGGKNEYGEEYDFEEEVRYLFEKYGAGEENPLATEEQIEEWYQVSRY